MKKAKFHYEAAAMAKHELARYNVGIIEAKSGNMERAVKHWRIAAAGGGWRFLCHAFLASDVRRWFGKERGNQLNFDSIQ